MSLAPFPLLCFAASLLGVSLCASPHSNHTHSPAYIVMMYSSAQPATLTHRCSCVSSIAICRCDTGETSLRSAIGDSSSSIRSAVQSPHIVARIDRCDVQFCTTFNQHCFMRLSAVYLFVSVSIWSELVRAL